MFKTIKWYAITCTVMILLADKMAQAGFPDKKKPLLPENVETTSQPVQGASHHVAAGSNAGTIASQTNRSTIVNKLDKMAVAWDFSNFNFAGLHEYFVGHISNIAFIEATLSGTYTCIYDLARALVDSRHCTITTLDEAKFFVYSALKSLHDRCVEYGRQQMVGFHLLRQANEAMRSYQMGNVVYHENKLAPDDAKTMLSVYPHSFTSNDHITGLLLANSLSNLISVINTYAEVSQKYEAPLSLVQAEKQPTVAELLQYFPDDHERVLAFLVYFPMETEMAGDDNPQPMNAETALKQQVSESLRKLWDAVAIHSAEYKQVAKIAIYLFAMNPFSTLSCRRFVDYQQSAASVSYVRNPSPDIDPASALTTLLNFWPRLITAIPMDDQIFFSCLLKYCVLNNELRDMIELQPTKSGKNSLFLKRIHDDLNVGKTRIFSDLLSVALKHGDQALQGMARDMCNELNLTKVQLFRS